MSEEKKESLTSEEYRQKADEHLNAVKGIWKIFGKTGIFVLAAAVAVIIFCVAWFASNTKVQVGSMSVQTAGNDFELAVMGTAGGKWDNLLTGTEDGAEQTINKKTYTVTDNSKNSIKWALTDSSNMNNNTEEGIRPGSCGEMTFYIYAKKTGSLEVSLNLALTGFVKGENTSLKPVSGAVQELLEGHILLFAGYDEMSKSYKGWISKDADPWTMQLNDGDVLHLDEGTKLTWTREVQAENVYPVTIYWIWPEVLGEFVFKDDANTGGRPILFPGGTGTEDPSALPSGLYNKMCDIESGATSNRYFKLTMENDKDFNQMCTKDILDNMREGIYSIPVYRKLCYYYNSADQYLGETVDYINLKLDAQ